MVQLALKRPYTFIVMAMLIVLASPFVLLKIATDIFPEIDIPVISIIWNYGGLPAQEMGQRIAAQHERSLTTTVSDIEHIESTSLAGISVIKVFFQPNANIQTAIAQVVAISQSQVRQLPPGMTPPLIIKYSASSIPVVQLGLSSPTLPEQTVFDAAVNTLRPQLVTIPGVAIPFPYGGKNRLISVDLDMQQLQARGLAPADVVNAVNLQNLILPSGTAKFAGTEYTVRMNGSPEAIAGLNDLPVRTSGGTTTYLKDVAYVRDGFVPQTNIVRQDGARGVLLSVLKNGGASTLDIVANLKALLPRVQATLPSDVKLQLLFDQSVFVKAAVQGVVFEALLAAGLTAAMVLLFLGNWRSTVIIALTIPLSILASILALHAARRDPEPDDARRAGALGRHPGRPGDRDDREHRAPPAPRQAARGRDHGRRRRDRRAGVRLDARRLHRLRADVLPLGRRQVPVRAAGRGGGVRDARLLHPVAHAGADAGDAADARLARPGRAGGGRAAEPAAARLPRLRPPFERVRAAYTALLAALLAKRGVFGLAFLAFCLLSCGLYPVLGRDFFPTVDAGQIRLHLRAATGTRIEETARLADDVEAAIRELVPKDQLETILDNLGVPNSGINLSYSNAGTIGTLDGEILLSLKKGHRPTEEFVTILRRELPKRFPGIEFFFQPADIVTQILNFGLPAAIDVQFTGNAMAANAVLAAELVKKIRQIPGAVDVHVHQRFDAPAVNLQMDRTRLQQMGLSAQNVGQNVLVSLSGQLADGAGVLAQPAERRRLPDRGAGAAVPGRLARFAAQRAGRRLRRHGRGTQTQLLGNLVEATPNRQPAVVSRYNISPAVDVYASVQGTDLASVAAKVQALVDEVRPKLPRGSQVDAARPGRDDAGLVPRPRRRPGDGDRPRLPAGGRQLPVVDRRLHHHRRPAGGARRHRLDAVHHRHDAVGAGAHRRDHDHGRGHRQQHPAGLVRPAAARRGRGAGRGGARRRRHPDPAGADDGAGDDHRHDPDGARHRRRRRAERAARPRRHRRPGFCDRLDAAVRAGRLCRHPRAAAAPPGAGATPFGGAAAPHLQES